MTFPPRIILQQSGPAFENAEFSNFHDFQRTATVIVSVVHFLKSNGGVTVCTNVPF